VLHHGYPVREGQGLRLVVGDVDRGDAELGLEALEEGPGGEAQLGVEVGQRLVDAPGR
jgi:hypothetical protein